MPQPAGDPPSVPCPHRQRPAVRAAGVWTGPESPGRHELLPPGAICLAQVPVLYCVVTGDRDIEAASPRMVLDARVVLVCSCGIGTAWTTRRRVERLSEVRGLGHHCIRRACSARASWRCWPPIAVPACAPGDAPFPEPGTARGWKADALWDLAHDFYVDRGARVTTMLAAQASDEASMRRLLRRSLRNYLIDRVRKTDLGALRQRLEELLRDDPAPEPWQDPGGLHRVRAALGVHREPAQQRGGRRVDPMRPAGDPGAVRSTRGAPLVFPPVGFLGPPPEPDVPVGRASGSPQVPAGLRGGLMLCSATVLGSAFPGRGSAWCAPLPG
jgi:hypothetical protein